MQTNLAKRQPGALELTVRGIVLGGLITLVFTAANVYLGLKVGLTFATSIPAAVISMAVLRAFRNATIWENNIVQTVASAAGTLSAVIFVLPGLVMISWWTHFPFWQSFAICAVGGTLGVMYSVPLRRALVTNSDLPYPEGVAAAEVLQVGAGERAGEAVEENKLGLLALLVSSIASALVQVGTAIGAFASEFKGYLKFGASATGMGFSTSLALVGVGHLIGLTVGFAIFGGLLIAWAVLVPILTAIHPTPGTFEGQATYAWAHYVRFIGAGTIGIAGIWTLLRLAMPVWNGIASSLRSSRLRAQGAEVDITEQDLPFNVVLIISLICLVPLAIVLWSFLSGTVLSGMIVPLLIAAMVYIVIVGFFIAAATGYMAGLIGASNSPVSGMAILTVIGASILLLIVAKTAVPAASNALIAYALFVTALLLNVATISNDNLQDLKTGQLVGATPWRQQVALVIGVLFGSIVIPPVLDVLNKAYGFGGTGLPAPQATLISTLAKGVIGGSIDWNLIGLGALIGVVVIIIDEIGRATKRFQFPPLAVGLGIYLPTSATAPAVVGAIFGALYNRWVASKPNAESARRLGVLIASGMIVGESLWGVLYAGIIVLAQNKMIPAVDPGAPFAFFGDGSGMVPNILAIVAFVGVPYLLYRWIGGKARAL